MQSGKVARIVATVAICPLPLLPTGCEPYLISQHRACRLILAEQDVASLQGALPLVLQRAASVVANDPRPIQLLCTVLSVSKAWRQAAVDNCAGSFPLVLGKDLLQKRKQLILWISRYGSLLCSILIEWDPKAAVHNELVSALSAALITAAPPSGLPLQSLVSTQQCISLETLLHLRTNSLSQLKVTITSADLGPSKPDLYYAISCLTSLRQLGLRIISSPLNTVLPALAHLSQLTSLNLHWLANGADLQLLPPQLVEVTPSTIHR